MTPEQIDRVFGRGRLKMATGEHVEVFREAMVSGERRRYTKRFLDTLEGDYGQWTEREWRILARLIGHGIRSVPEVVQFDRGALSGARHVQTYDAGATVDQWATILPVSRQGRVHRHVFEDCAHWWALAHHSLLALKEIHELQVVHLDVKGDNICIPVGPADFDPDAVGLLLYPRFDQLALIDFAFALVSGEKLSSALPLGWETDYDYQSPRLLSALEAGRGGDLKLTRELDWRCDMYSLAAMLKRYLPEEDVVYDIRRTTGWSAERYDAAKRFVLALRQAHDRDMPHRLPHHELIEVTHERVSNAELNASLQHGWTLARDASLAPVAASPLTPVTRLAAPIRLIVSPRVEAPAVIATRASARERVSPRARLATIAIALIAVVGAGLGLPLAPKLGDGIAMLADSGANLLDFATTALGRLRSDSRAPQGNAVPPIGERLAATQTTGSEAVAASEPANDVKASPQPANESEQSAAAGTATSTPVKEASSTSSDAPTPAPNQEAQPVEQTSAPPVAATAPPAHSRRAPTSARSAQPRAAPSSSQALHSPAALAKRSVQVDTAKFPPASSTELRIAPPLTQPQPESPQTQVQPVMPREVEHGAGTSIPALPTAPTRAELTSAAPIVASTASAERSTSQVAAAPPETRLAPSAAGIEPRRPTPALEPATRDESNPAPQPREATPPAQTTGRSEARHAASGLGGLLSSLFNLARGDGKMAPVEERTPRTASSQAPASRPATRAAQSGAPQAPETARPELASAGVAPLEESRSPGSEPPQVLATPLSTYPAQPPVSAATPSSITRAASAVDPSASTEPRARPPGWEPAPSSAQSTPSAPAPAPGAVFAASAEDYAALAKRMLAQSVPRTAMQAEAEVSRVMLVAAKSYRLAQERDIVDAARRAWPTDVVAIRTVNPAPGSARQLNDRARQAFLSHRDPVEALDLQLQAFGANPRDAEVAGNLAFLYLRLSPPQPEMARQVALHAIAVSSVDLHAMQADDWLTFAVASALVGRQGDATNALYVTIALARDLDRSCRAAASTVASYGDRLRVPVQAMMLRIHSQGRDYESPNCTWPPRGALAQANF